MIIACPECTGPFEVADGHIAPLVQVECPTCNFRMILDFEAANDASLREDGMSMTQGFRDELSYRQAVGAGQVVYSAEAGRTAAKSPRPDLRAVPDQPAITPPVREPAPEPVREPEPPVTATPQPVVDAPPVRRAPVEQPPVRQPIASPPVEQPVVEQPVVEQAPLDKPPVRHPPTQHPPTQPTAQPDRPRSRPTLIAHTPPPPQPVVTPPEPVAQPTVAPQSEAQVETHVGPAPTGPGSIAVDLDEDEVGIEVEVDETPAVSPTAEAAPPVRTPPHTPVREPATEPTPEPPRPEPGVTSTKPTDKQADEEAQPDENQPKGSAGKTALKLAFLFLLLAVGGLMAWSIATTGDPFQKILELTGAAPPADAEKADQKSDAKSK